MKLFARLGLLLLLVAALCCAVSAADHTADDLQELYNIMWENYKLQDESFTVEYTGNLKDLHDENGELYSCAALTRQMAAAIPNTAGNGADIQMMNLRSGLCFLNESELRFAVTYLLDHEKLAFMDRKAEEIAAGLGVAGKGDYQKVKAVQEYMTTHFYYDATTSKYTDYDGVTTGTMVCQGYALLTYRLLWKLNIPCRILAGSSFQQPHGWNLVRVNGRWYSMDTTWDSRTETEGMRWDYFLHDPLNFESHTTDPAFLSQAFLEEYPPAGENYRLLRVKILVNDEAFGALILRNGKSTRLTTAIDPATDREIIWTSSDPSVITVAPDGTLQSLRPGAVTITATVAGDDRYIPGTFPVTGVDTASCSEWAYEELNSYYLRSLYPAEMCGEYTSAITREEFANLVYLLLSKYYTTGGMFNLPEFEDIEQSPYWMGIIYTVARRIFEGTGPNTFSPTDPLTREQAAKVLCALMDHMGIELPALAEPSFADAASVSSWAEEYVRRAAAAGLFVGDAAGNFNPRQPLTREQTAVLLERIVVQYVEPLMAAPEAA